jgi:hypothetical protein
MERQKRVWERVRKRDRGVKKWLNEIPVLFFENRGSFSLEREGWN